MKKFSIFLFTLLTLIPSISFSKGSSSFSSGGGGSRSSYSGGSSYSNSSKSSGSSYSNSYSKPSTPSTPSSYSNSYSKPAPSSSYSNSAGTTYNKPVQTVQPKSQFQQRANAGITKQNSTKALSDYKAQQSKFRQAPSSYTKVSPRSYTTVNHYNVSSGDYYIHRSSFYGRYNYHPAYMYNSYPYFGMWDGMALWFMLDHINDRQYAMMYYNQQNNPDMIQWRQEANRLAQDNADLRNKLNQMDNQTRNLNGQPVDPSYIPEQMRDVAFSANAIEQANQQAQVQPQQQMNYQPPQPVKKETHYIAYTIAGIIVICGVVWWLL